MPKFICDILSDFQTTLCYGGGQFWWRVKRPPPAHRVNWQFDWPRFGPSLCDRILLENLSYERAATCSQGKWRFRIGLAPLRRQATTNSIVMLCVAFSPTQNGRGHCRALTIFLANQFRTVLYSVAVPENHMLSHVSTVGGLQATVQADKQHWPLVLTNQLTPQKKNTNHDCVELHHD